MGRKQFFMTGAAAPLAGQPLKHQQTQHETGSLIKVFIRKENVA